MTVWLLLLGGVLAAFGSGFLAAVYLFLRYAGELRVGVGPEER